MQIGVRHTTVPFGIGKKITDKAKQVAASQAAQKLLEGCQSGGSPVVGVAYKAFCLGLGHVVKQVNKTDASSAD